MGNTLCCPHKENYQQLKPAIHIEDAGVSNIMDAQKKSKKPASKMTKLSTNSRISRNNNSRVSQNNKSYSQNMSSNTVYYSFDNSMETGQGRNTAGFGTDKEKGIESGQLANFLGQITEDSEGVSNTSNIHGSTDQLIEDSKETKESSKNQKEKRPCDLNNQRQNENTFNAIDEAREENEEESFFDPNSTIKEETRRSVSLDQSPVVPKRNSRIQVPAQQEVLVDVGLDPIHLDLQQQAESWIELVQTMHQTSFEGYDKIYEEKKNSHKLKVYMNIYENKQGYKINCTKSEFFIPFRAHQYLEFMSDCREQKGLDKNIDIYNTIKSFAETPDKCYTIYYLSYKKVLTASPRDFVYLKYYKKLNDDVWCDVSKSIVYNGFPEYKDKTRGEIILSGNLISEFTDPITGRVNSKVQLYAENNFKINIPAFITKNFASGEMKKYVESCIQRMSKIYTEK